MSINMNDYVVEEEQNIDNHENETSIRNLFTHQTGQVLVTLGTVFKYIPPFNDHIDENTGQMLISIGKKLKSTK